MFDYALMRWEFVVRDLQKMIDRPAYGVLMVMLCVLIWLYKVKQEG